jgi:hypothetical protein
MATAAGFEVGRDGGQMADALESPGIFEEPDAVSKQSPSTLDAWPIQRRALSLRNA